MLAFWLWEFRRKIVRLRCRLTGHTYTKAGAGIGFFEDDGSQRGVFAWCSRCHTSLWLCSLPEGYAGHLEYFGTIHGIED